MEGSQASICLVWEYRERNLKASELITIINNGHNESSILVNTMLSCLQIPFVGCPSGKPHKTVAVDVRVHVGGRMA